MKIVIYTHDPMVSMARSEEATVELFGREYFEEYAIEVPDELAKEALEVKARFFEISRALAAHRTLHEEATSKQLCSGCHQWKIGVKRVDDGGMTARNKVRLPKKLCPECLQNKQEIPNRGRLTKVLK